MNANSNDASERDPALEALAGALGPIYREVTASTTDVCVNLDGRCALYRRGSARPRWLTARLSADGRRAITDLVAGYINGQCDAAHVRLEARLPASLRLARFEGLVPPAVPAPVFSLRFPSERPLSLRALVKNGSLTREEADRIVRAVKVDKKSGLIVGTTSAGKTTLLNAILSKLDERLLIVEDTPEITVNNPNTIYITTGEHLSTAEALKACLRMRPDRIIIGELRDGSAVQNYLNSCVSGHPGLCTLHATAETVVSRLHGLVVQETGHAPDVSLIYEAVDFVVQVEQVLEPGGRMVRKVTSITELERKTQEEPTAPSELDQVGETAIPRKVLSNGHWPMPAGSVALNGRKARGADRR